MRLALDATYALDPNPTGVARYSRRLIEALAALDEPDLQMTLAARTRRFAALHREFPGGRFRLVLLQEPLNWVLPRATDIFHGLNQRLPSYQFQRAVTTIHDVFALSSERYASQDFRARFGAMIHDVVTRSDKLIAVSAYTRDELCRVTGCDPARVTVVHHGVDAPAPNARVNTGGDPYFLSVGVVQTRKNTLAAVRAIELLRPRVKLIVAGGLGFGAEETLDYIRRQGLVDRVELRGHCDEPTLDQLYAGATALIFPSFEEGFGFPILEAMAHGLPVIAARASSIPEIAGDAALLFDPLDHKGMAEACQQLLEDASLAGRLAELGRARASRFTWERTARETLAVYRCIM